MKTKIRILLADDHLVVRMGIASILSFEKDIEVIGETDNGADAVRLVRELKPDVVLMDLKMPQLNGADATMQIHATTPDVKILILTTFGTSAELKKAMDCGAAGALLKNSSQAEIIDAIREVMSGKCVMNYEIQHGIEELKSVPKSIYNVVNTVSHGACKRKIISVAQIGGPVDEIPLYNAVKESV